MTLRNAVGRLLRRAGLRKSGPSQPSTNPNMVVVLEDEHLRVTQLGDSSQPYLVICFTGIQQRMGGVGAEEFVGTSQMPGFSALFVSDLKRSWYNDFDPEHLLGAIRPYTEGKKIVTVGNSMGGFGAIWMSGLLPVETVVAFAPQFSVKPDLVPGETRWQEYRSAIADWRVPSLAGSFVPGTRYFTINGDADEMHYRQFPAGENMRHYLLPGCGHAPAKLLKDRGILGDVFRLCAKGADPASAIRAAGIELHVIGESK